MTVAPNAAATALSVLGNVQQIQFLNQALRAAQPCEFGGLQLADLDLTDLERARQDLATLRLMSQESPHEAEMAHSLACPASLELAVRIAQTREHLLRSVLPSGNRVFLSFEPLGKGSSQVYAQKLMNAAATAAEAAGLAPQIQNLRIEDKLFVSGILRVTGPGAYRHFHQESGVHRFEGRDPINRRDSRTHTQFVAVTVHRSLDEETALLDLDPRDVEVSHFGSCGPGGQNVNKSQRGVRLVHTPTGLTESCMDQRSQLANYKIAWARLSEKVQQAQREEARDKGRQARRKQLSPEGALQRTRNYDMDTEVIHDQRLPGRSFSAKEFFRGRWNDLRDSLWQWSTLRALGVERTSESDFLPPDLVEFALSVL